VVKYIEECIDSLIKQDYKNIEIITVNDGSPDSSRKILDKLAKKDKRIKVVNKKNGGVSSARNAGLDIATGEYIMFVDGDDWVEPDYVSYLMKVAQETGSDVAVSINEFTAFGKEQIRHDKIEVYTSERAVQEGLMFNIAIGVWNKIFRADLIRRNKLGFNTKLWFGEGFTFELTAFQLANQVGVGRRRVYHQRSNPESVTRKFNMGSWQCGLWALKQIRENLTIKTPAVYRAWDYHWWWGNFSICLETIKAGAIVEHREEYRKAYREVRRYALRQLCSDATGKRKIIAIASFVSPALAVRIFDKHMKRVAVK
jgi:glycosyltransferase involved in cell wall biosynthesis